MANDRGRYGGRNQFADDALYVDESTTIDEVKQFIAGRVENPFEHRGTYVFNFSSYPMHEDALRRSIESKLEWDGEYIIPFQVSGTWAFIFHLLPTELKKGDVLVYHPDDGEYFAYTNFYRMLSPEQVDAFRQDLARRVEDIRQQE